MASAAQLARVEAAVDAQARARASLTRSLLVAVLRLWRAMSDRYDPAQVQAYTDGVAAVLTQARRVQAAATEQYLRTVLAALDADPGPVLAAPDPLPRGIDLGVELVRPVKTYRRLRLEGLDDLEAATAAERRALLGAETDLTLADRDASRAVLVAADRVTGWRRIVRPELSAGGPCGLCIAASDRTYRVDQLRPLHDRCVCLTLPVTATSDPGRSLNRDDLARLYADAGSTAAAALKRTRFTVHEHGELGPVLREASDEFRGPADVAADTGADSAA